MSLDGLLQAPAFFADASASGAEAPARDRRPPSPPAEEVGSNVALEARQVILTSYTDDSACSTTRLAEDLGVTPSHLCHVYKSTWGVTIGAELRRLRMDLAKRLLADRDLHIKQVAARVGYGRATYRAFFNAFRAETGMPPSRYRRLLLRSLREKDPGRTEPWGSRLEAAVRDIS